MAGAVCNVLLSLLKLIAGFAGRSSAMIADGVHSLSDLVSDVVVVIFARITGMERDCRHEYGHGRFETLATLAVSLLLLVAGASMLSESVEKVVTVLKGGEIVAPGMIALWAALLSIIVKEGLYQWTNAVGKRINSSVMVANAWHHRSDALSSIGSLLGIGGALLLGGRWSILDPVAGGVISIIIIVVAVKMALPALTELVDTSLPRETEERIVSILLSTSGVISVHELKTRSCGHYYVIEAHVVVNPSITVLQAHDITVEAEKSIRSAFGQQTQISIHVEPNEEAL